MSTRFTLVLDLDDTLFAERDFVRSGFEAVGRMMEGQGAAGFGAICWRLFETGVRGDIFDRALAEIGGNATPDTIAALVACYRGHTPRIALAEDAARLLDRLDAAGQRFAVVTDGPLQMQRAKLAALGLDRRAAAAICTDRWGRDGWKPNERGFRAAAETLGQGPFVYVGDNPVKDFIAPRRMGWLAVRLRRAGGEHAEAEPDGPNAAPHAEIASLDALDDVLRKQEAAE
ncbi:MAG: HAD family hydrolase [Paracoccaceae bacterium]